MLCTTVNRPRFWRSSEASCQLNQHVKRPQKTATPVYTAVKPIDIHTQLGRWPPLWRDHISRSTREKKSNGGFNLMASPDHTSQWVHCLSWMFPPFSHSLTNKGPTLSWFDYLCPVIVDFMVNTFRIDSWSHRSILFFRLIGHIQWKNTVSMVDGSFWADRILDLYMHIHTCTHTTHTHSLLGGRVGGWSRTVPEQPDRSPHIPVSPQAVYQEVNSSRPVTGANLLLSVWSRDPLQRRKTAVISTVS